VKEKEQKLHESRKRIVKAEEGDRLEWGAEDSVGCMEDVKVHVLIYMYENVIMKPTILYSYIC
jgi:hypothetical protein